MILDHGYKILFWLFLYFIIKLNIDNLLLPNMIYNLDLLDNGLRFIRLF